jgi:8-oxo-dGTP diphosphatase
VALFVDQGEPRCGYHRVAFSQLTRQLAADRKGLVDPVRVPVGVAVLVFNPQGAVLLGQRTGKHGAGTWSFPGDWMDPGERPEAAAAREVMKETGLQIAAIEPFTARPYIYTTFRPELALDCVTLYFRATADGVPERREPDKCLHWVWCDPRTLPFPLFKPLMDGGIREILAQR